VIDIDVGGRQAAWVGMDPGNGLVYVEGKGETSPDLVASIRTHWPGHSCSRLDAAEDYKGEGSFERLQACIRAAALRPARGAAPVLGYTAFPDDPVKGRTWGSMARGKGTVAYLRLYESGKIPERAHWGLDAVRAELEVRPHSAAHKRLAARLSPVEVWGMAAWSHRVAEALTSVDVPRFLSPVSPYTQEKTTLYLARTYRKHWQEMLSDFGSWECIGREFGEVWRLDDESAKRRR